jgi:hypothetical protein
MRSPTLADPNPSRETASMQVSARIIFDWSLPFHHRTLNEACHLDDSTPLEETA